MTFPNKLLAPGEEIVLESRPHWSVLVPRAFMLLVVLAGCIAVVVLFASAPIWVGYILAAIGLAAVVAFFAKLVAWRAASLVLTTSRVVYRSGVVRRIGREIPINRIQDVTFRQSLLERVLGAGALTIESAGEGGQEPFPDIRRPARVQSLISQLVSLQLEGRSYEGGTGRLLPAERRRTRKAPEPERRRQPAYGEGPGRPGDLPFPAAPAGTSAIPQQLEHLAHLHREGVLTDAEFEAKKRELLDRF